MSEWVQRSQELRAPSHLPEETGRHVQALTTREPTRDLCEYGLKGEPDCQVFPQGIRCRSTGCLQEEQRVRRFPAAEGR